MTIAMTIADTSDDSTISLSSSYLVYGVGISLSLTIVMNIGVASIGQRQSSYCLHPSLGSIGYHSNIVKTTISHCILYRETCSYLGHCVGLGIPRHGRDSEIYQESSHVDSSDQSNVTRTGRPAATW